MTWTFRRGRNSLFWCVLGAGIVVTVNFVYPGTSAPSNVPVLRLTYRGPGHDALSTPYSIGMLFSHESWPVMADFVGTDWDGSIYIMDPQRRRTESSISCWLKRFDRHGKFQEAWGPLDASFSDGVAVTKDGYIWTSLVVEDRERIKGFPIVVFQKGRKHPVIDWRDRLPRDLFESVSGTLGKAGLKWGNYWDCDGLYAGTSTVALVLGGDSIPAVNYVARSVWVTLTSEGVVQHSSMGWTDGVAEYLAPDGREWRRKLDHRGLAARRWTKVWFWETGKEMGAPLIDRSVVKEPWPEHITLGNANPPYVLMDAKGRFYLDLAREESPRGDRKVEVEGRVFVESAPDGEGERSLVVLDKNRRVIACVPWIKNSFEFRDKWLKPLPDGSGFYRIQFQEKEAVVYFHPLPK